MHVWVITFLERKDRHAENAEFARLLAETVDIFLERIADEDQRVDLARTGLLDGVTKHLAKLGMARPA